nr:hypothetical protein [Xanthomonas vesicatoria]
MAGRAACRTGHQRAGAGPCASADGRDPARHVRSRAHARPDRRRARACAAGGAGAHRHFWRCRSAAACGTADPDAGGAGRLQR